jgi:hypothetical protein
MTNELAARLLDCWREIVQRIKKMTLEEYSKSNPSWGDICALSDELYNEFVATNQLEDTRQLPDSKRDRIFENGQLFLRDNLLYVEHAHATRFGDIGRIEDTFLPIMWMSKATGKHKYASTILKYIANVKGNWPPELSA